MSMLPRTIWLDSVDSTNRYLADSLASDPGLAEWTTVAAEEQTAGRGRLDHRWSSPRGLNIACSILVRTHAAPADVATLPLAAGLAVARAVEKGDGSLRGRLRIKWPNDVWIDGRKLCGILCEVPSLPQAALADGATPVIVGIGINVNSEAGDFPADIRETATSLRIATGASHDRRDLLEGVRSELSMLLGPGDSPVPWSLSPILGELRERDALLGREIAVEAGGDVERGRAAGIADDGSLLLSTPGAGLIPIYAGDVHVRASNAPR